MKTIMFDVDGVLADFASAFTQQCKVPRITSNNQQAWDFPEIPKNIQSDAWSVIRHSTDWWMHLLPLVPSDVFWQIDELADRNQLLFVTSRVGIGPQFQTETWLRHMGIQNPHVIVSKRKGDIAKAVDADYSIDDKAENAACVHWIADVKPCRSYLLDRPYNTLGLVPKNVRRIYTVEEYLHAIVKDL